jgi:hypothetical protein
MASIKTIKVGGHNLPFDGSKAGTAFVDVFTEQSVIEGIVHLGLGHIVSGDSQDHEVRGDVYLRMTPAMAARVVDVLNNMITTAAGQAADARPNTVRAAAATGKSAPN